MLQYYPASRGFFPASMFLQLVGHGYDLLLLIAMKFECETLIYRDYFKCKTGLVRFARFFPSPVKDAVQTNSA